MNSRDLNQEVVRTYPDVAVGNTLDQTLINLTNHTGNKLVMIIDEWDAPIRETPEIEKAYLSFLRMLFKGSGTTSRIFAAVYMTGILPIKKDGSQSAISDFEEYTMVKPRHFAEFVGFTENEVRRLCEEGDISFDRMKQWYDGYHFKTIGSAYNPNSVMKAIRYHDFDSYWSQTSAAEGLMRYISQDYSGLTKTIAELIGGVDVPVNTTGFSNDLTTFRGKDDVLTLLIHLGYLAYDSEKGTARIPNEEIRMEFQRSIREVRHKGTRERLRESDQLFYDTVHKNEAAVASCIEKVHREETAPLHYNREDSLRSVIKLAYYTYRDHYLLYKSLRNGYSQAKACFQPDCNHSEGQPV